MNGRTALMGAALAGALALAASGCGGSGQSRAAVAAAKRPACPSGWRAGWQKLANRIGAPVYCPGWIPSPLTGQIGGRWSSGAQVGKDRSYLAGFIWVEHGSEIHVNLRGYPGRSRVPTCVATEQVGKRKDVPCFADAKWTKKVGGREITLYTVNRDADQWHLLFAWRAHGGLYALSEHVAPPFGYRRVVENLFHMYRNLVLIEPQA